MSAGRIKTFVSVTMIAATIGFVVYADRRESRRSRERITPATLLGGPRAPTTSREDLERTITAMQARVDQHPADSGAAVLLADALLRNARVTGNAALALRAERAIASVLADEPMDYNARRMLGAVYLSEHRFRAAIQEGERARAQHPDDAWNYGIIGDGHLELGEYDEAFAAFQRMLDLKPTAAAYARAAYARELQGDLAGALENMRMSANATSPRDPESLAWHHAQVGDLLLQLNRVQDAAVEYGWANAAFPNHPFAIIGLGRVKEAAGDYAGALQIYAAEFQKRPTPDLAERIGDLHEALGNHADADRAYALAEAGWRVDAPDPRSLARFLADHDRKPDEALALARDALTVRQDIYTEDAFAWAAFKAGRIEDARPSVSRVLRTGTRDRRLLVHAAAIRNRAGDPAGAQLLLNRVFESRTSLDPAVERTARRVRAELDGARRVAAR